MFFKKKKPETSQRKAGEVDYTLVRTSRRTLALQIKEGELIVRAPHRTPLREIEDWIFAKRRWISRHQQKSLAKKENAPLFQEGARHPFLGADYPLRIKKGVKTGGDLVAGEIVLTLRGEVTPKKIEGALKGWYKHEATRVFHDRLLVLFPPFSDLGHALPDIRQRWMKGRWGSMSATGNMSLNTQLIKKNIDLIDYVIVHELCHMEHMNHGPGFYALMDQMLPGWKPLRKNLKGDL